AAAARRGAGPGPARRAPAGPGRDGRAGGGPGPPGSAAAPAPLPVGAALACPQSARFETAGTVAGGGPRPVPPERGRDGAGRGPPPMPVPRPAVCAGPWRPPGDSVNRSPPERYVLPDRADGGRRRAMTTTGATGKPCERARDDPSYVLLSAMALSRLRHGLPLWTAAVPPLVLAALLAVTAFPASAEVRDAVWDRWLSFTLFLWAALAPMAAGLFAVGAHQADEEAK